MGSGCVDLPGPSKITDSEEEGTRDKDFGLIVNGKCDEGKKGFIALTCRRKTRQKCSFQRRANAINLLGYNLRILCNKILFDLSKHFYFQGVAPILL